MPPYLASSRVVFIRIPTRLNIHLTLVQIEHRLVWSPYPKQSHRPNLFWFSPKLFSAPLVQRTHSKYLSFPQPWSKQESLLNPWLPKQNKSNLWGSWPQKTHPVQPQTAFGALVRGRLIVRTFGFITAGFWHGSHSAHGQR